MRNTLYYGDNLPVLREHIADESVDLIYLDPPFNSNATYNVLFKEKSGKDSAAQIEAFDDTWQWDMAAARALDEIVRHGGEVGQAMRAFEQLLGHNDMLAYLAMMSVRLVELRRVLKPTGSIYLHCDPTASHYLKIILDSIFDNAGWRNEIIWSYGGRGAKARSKQFPRNHDVIFWYSCGKSHTYHRQYRERVLSERQARGRGYRQDDDGKWFKTAPRGDYTDESIARLESEGRIYRTRTGTPRVKYFLESRGGKVVEPVLIGDVWKDIPDAMHMGKERLGYPTQKPQALLERIIEASSNEGDVVLDPFCGCGTAVAAAQQLNRRWIGIDITHLAVNLMKRRLKDTFGEDLDFDVVGEPTTVSGAQELAEQDRFQFEWWALDLVNAQPNRGKKKGADRGIDGRKFFRDATGAGSTYKEILVSVKSGKNNVAHVRDLVGVVTREKAAIGVLICLEEPTAPMRREAATAGFYDSPWGSTHPKIQILTIEEILDGKGIDFPRVADDATFQRAAQAERKAKGQQHKMDL